MLPTCARTLRSQITTRVQCTIASMKLHLARVLPLLLSAWARARAPTAAPLNVSWDPWTNFSFSARQWDCGTCGNNKCYFPGITFGGQHWQSATGERDAEGREMGWLIHPLDRHGRPELSTWMRTWEFAKDLHTRYGAGANHLFLGPPRRFAIGNSDAALLNAHLIRHQSTEHPRHWQTSASTRFREGNVLVQPVRSCPSSSCFLIKGWKKKTRETGIEAIVEIENEARFMHALEQNVRSLNAMMRETTCLQSDFQVFVCNDGQIFHLDMDRCFDWGGKMVPHRRDALVLWSLLPRVMGWFHTRTKLTNAKKRKHAHSGHTRRPSTDPRLLRV